MPKLFDYGAILGFLILSFGLIAQIRKTIKRKSVKDIERADVVSRLVASVLVFAKMWYVNDVYLIIGQGILMINLAVYFLLTIAFNQGRKDL
jgi:hypothetical protein